MGLQGKNRYFDGIMSPGKKTEQLARVEGYMDKSSIESIVKNPTPPEKTTSSSNLREKFAQDKEFKKLSPEHQKNALYAHEKLFQSGLAKLYSSEAAMGISTEAVQIHGGYGYLADYGLENLFAICVFFKFLKGQMKSIECLQ